MKRNIVIALGALAVVVAFLRGMLFTPGSFAFGDYVTPGPNYAFQSLGAWNPFEHGGEPTALNLSQAPALLIGTTIGRIVGMATYDKLCLAASFIVACLAIVVLLRTVEPRITLPTAFVLGVFYAFNPWTASHIASGHLALMWAYALTPALLTTVRLTGWQRIVSAAIVLAVTAANDFHMAELAAFIYVVLVASWLRAWRDATIAAAAVPLAAIGLSAWWLVGVLTTPGVHLPAQQVATENVMAQHATMLGVLMLRSYWWTDFSQTIYTFNAPALSFVVALGCVAPSLFVLAALPRIFRQSRVARAFAFLWVGTVCLVCVSHYVPPLYYFFLRLPLMAPFRDPNKLLPLAIIAATIVLGISSATLSARLLRICSTSFAIALFFATASWWAGGDLQGRVRPLPFPSPDFLATMSWLGTHAQDTNTLWVPIGPYVAYNSYRYGAQDPVRFYSQTPTLNPYYDPTYDFSPGTSTFLEFIERGIRGGSLPYLGQALAPYDVHYIVLRTDAWPLPPPDPLTVGSLDAVRDVALVKRFGAISVYENRAWHPGHTQSAFAATYASKNFEWIRGTLPLDVGDAYVVDSLSSDHASEINDAGGMITRLTQPLIGGNALSPAGAGRTWIPATGESVDYSLPGSAGYLLIELSGRSAGFTVTDALSKRILAPIDGDFDETYAHRIVYWISAGVTKVQLASTYAGINVEGVALVPPDVYRNQVQAAQAALREQWIAYVFRGDELYPLARNSVTTQSNFIGPIIFNAHKRWEAHITGARLTLASVRVESAQGGKAWGLSCAPNGSSCDGPLNDVPSAAARVALTFKGSPAALEIHPASVPPWRVASTAGASFPHLLGLKQSYSEGWVLHCPRGGTVRPTFYNYWLPSFVVPENGCRLAYDPATSVVIGRIISVLTLFGLGGLLFLEQLRRSAFAEASDGRGYDGNPGAVVD